MTARITVDSRRSGPQVSKDLYGIFFEEINCAGDGGLYAELVRNRSFEDSDKPDHWSLLRSGAAQGGMSLDREHPLTAANPTSLKISHEGGVGHVTAINEGYWGIAVKKGETYRLSLSARSQESLPFRVSIEGQDGRVYASTNFESGADWKTFTGSLTSSLSDPKARLAISVERSGTLWIDMVSLFPERTFNNRSNGLRSDLAGMLYDIRPSFVRFPGGCWVEGDTMATSQRWKRTVGALEERRTQYNLWQYMSTNGLGFHEYLQMCEDLGAAALFVINCGMSHREVVPIDKMDEFVQDALDAIEYANGPTTSKWGALRAANGHPAPFHLKYLEIGNENGGEAYRERFPLIARAVKSKYPEVKLITNVWGGYPKGPFTEIIDEHYYSSPQFFFENAERYDRYDRKGPNVYVGEYAVTEGCGAGNLIAALGEAAFMTGMERNSDVVVMASYAPLFANVNYKKWNPDLINFDNHRALGTPSYYVQQMFSRNRGDVVLPASIEVSGVPTATYPSGGVGVGTWGTQAEYKDVKVVAADGRVLLDSPDGSKLTNRSGQWSPGRGTITQTSDAEGARIWGGSPSWSNYVLSLKARKLGGREGFLINFGMADERNWTWWNIGGWGNTIHAIERSANGGKSRLGGEVRGSVETGRWYDIKIEYSPTRIRCYLDGKLVHDVPCPQVKPLHLVATKVKKTGDVLLKVVNGGNAEVVSTIELQGVLGLLQCSALTLTSASPLDENTLDQPLKVSPKQRSFSAVGPQLTHSFPAYSVTVLRISKH